MLKAAKLHARWQRIYDGAYEDALADGELPWRADKLAVSKVHEKFPNYSRRHIRREIIPH
jgi:hypothetical protein